MRDSDNSTVSIPIGKSVIQGDLTIPAGARAIVIFAHGSGSSRHSARNKYVAEVLNRAGLATLLVDLLTLEEEYTDRRTAEHRFNIALLTERLIGAADFVCLLPGLADLRRGFFGASTGAAAALLAAARRPDLVQAIVSRGGRPDLAGHELSHVAAPTLLIAGEFDREVVELNRQAEKLIRAPAMLQVVPRATHLFEEEGALEKVASLARQWFENELLREHAA